MLRKAILRDDPLVSPSSERRTPLWGSEKGQAGAIQQGGYQDESTSLKIELLSTSMS